MTNTETKPAWFPGLQHFLALVPDNGERRIMLGRYADTYGMSRDEFKARCPGFEVAISSFDDFEHVLAYFAQDVTNMRHGIEGATQERYDAIISEMVRALLVQALQLADLPAKAS